jgi:dihydropteroate synthase
MGVLNVTPDSFSDGGLYLEPQAAVGHGVRMVEQGADLIDVGGESTRPGADPIGADEQHRRVIPVICGLRQAGVQVPISIDTRSAKVAEAALQAGADAVNDVSALRHDGRLVEVVRDSGAGLLLMHMRGTPQDMQVDPRYGDVVAEVRGFLAERAALASDAGVPGECIAVDPGIGFGKTLNHNLLLLRHLDQFVGLGYPVLLGVSRKTFLGQLLKEERPERRVMGTAAAVAWAAFAGVHIVRVHDVAEIVQTLTVCRAILAEKPTS